MDKLKLGNVTLICLSDVKIPQSIKAIEICKAFADFGAVKFLTSKPNDYEHTVQIDTPIYSINKYSEFMIERLADYVDTDYCLVVQWDGFILNPEAWTDEFMQYDFVGAPYGQHPLHLGNGGFSLRSKKLLDELQTLSYFNFHKGVPEDKVICQLLRPALENVGCKFPDLETAEKFSSEGLWNGEFGFHDLNLNRVADRLRSVFTDYHKGQPMTGMHSGDLGDIIYCIPTIRALGITRLALNPTRSQGTNFGRKNYEAIIPLLEAQGIEVVEYTDEVHVDYYLDSFRKCLIDLNSQHLALSQAKAMQATVDLSEPFIAFPKYDKVYDIVVNKTERYSGGMNYETILNPFKHTGCKMAFIGHKDEYYKFAQSFNCFDVEYIETETLLDAARVIASAKVFVGNQSSLFAIAEGLKVNRVLEVCAYANNCMPQSDNGFAWVSGYHDGLTIKFIKRYLRDEN